MSHQRPKEVCGTTRGHSLTYFDELGHEHRAEFNDNEYHSLMELLFDKYIEPWGDCKGRAWCGTCHIEILEGTLTQEMEGEEANTLSKLYNRTKHSRLACQIPVNSQLDQIVFRIVEPS